MSFFRPGHRRPQHVAQVEVPPEEASGGDDPTAATLDSAE